MKVVFAGGGTGGHIFPGIAVARGLARLQSDVEVEFWGGGRPLEVDLFGREEMPFRVLPAAPLPRNPIGVPKFLLSLASGYLKARRLLKKSGVSALVGLGGYSSFAPVLAASRLGLATVLLEQNVIPGLANRRLARRAGAVCLSWEASEEFLPPTARTEVTGNPVRENLVKAARVNRYDSGGALLILGGSTGAVGLNSAVMEAAREAAALGRPVVHQAGRPDAERVKGAYAEAGVEAEVTPFISDMAGAYGRAALVVARAGGTTLAELALFGLPAVLVPYPHHKDRHQNANAQVFAREGAGRIIEESEGPAVLLRVVRELLTAPVQLESMHAAALSLGRPEAADLVADIILKLIETGGRAG